MYSIDAQRGENPEDLFYLCNIKNKYYIVYETDYVGGLSYVVKEIAEILPKDKKILHWLVKKDMYDAVGAKTLKTTIKDEDKKARDALIYNAPGYLRYVVLELESTKEPVGRYNPTVYGYTEK